MLENDPARNHSRRPQDRGEDALVLPLHARFELGLINIADHLADQYGGAAAVENSDTDPLIPKMSSALFKLACGFGSKAPRVHLEPILSRNVVSASGVEIFSVLFRVHDGWDHPVCLSDLSPRRVPSGETRSVFTRILTPDPLGDGLQQRLHLHSLYSREAFDAEIALADDPSQYPGLLAGTACAPFAVARRKAVEEFSARGIDPELIETTALYRDNAGLWWMGTRGSMGFMARPTLNETDCSLGTQVTDCTIY